MEKPEHWPKQLLTDLRMVEECDKEHDIYGGIYFEKQLTDTATGESQWVKVDMETREV